MATTTTALILVENAYSKKNYTRAEVSLHNKREDLWIIVYGRVYDVTDWAPKHPGGKRIIQHYGGEDASIAFDTFHKNKKFARGYMAKYYIGDVVEEERELPEISKDFLRLRDDLMQKGLFKANPWYYILFFIHIALFEVLGVLILWRYGTGWLPWLLSSICLATAQTQAGWFQHDFGHRSLSSNTRLNKLLHCFTMPIMKGLSGEWWNYRHTQHHAKPNVFIKDPDITISHTFLLGKTIPAKWGRERRGWLPFNLQHKYFVLTMPPLLYPTYFHIDCAIYMFKKREWWDAIWMTSFALRWHYFFASVLGGFWASFRLYFFVRILESLWFTWTSQMNHVPMDVDYDQKRDWASMQLATTCNVEPGWFSDWFLGHLNYQIEHHLFPTMPSHSFFKAQPYVQEFCRKHGLNYQLKPLWTAYADIVRSLKKSGEIWQEAWEMGPMKYD